MGFSASWLAVQGAPREDVLARLGLEPSTKRSTHPNFRVCITELPDGWILVWFNRDLKAAFSEAVVGLSRGRSVIACAIEEHVMFQEARGYLGGEEAWRVTHNPDKGGGVYHLEVAGVTPPQFAKIHADLKAEQDAEGGEEAEVDFIADVPLELAKSICGFRHDEQPPAGVVFEETRRAAASTSSARPSFLARLFGAR